LYYVTDAIVSNLEYTEGAQEIKFLKVITEPFTKAILEIDSDVLNGWAVGNASYENATLLKIWCEPTVKCMRTENLVLKKI
jgi:hypothetical protein